MDPIALAAILIVAAIALAGRIYLQQWLLARGVQSVIGRLAAAGAISPETAGRPDRLRIRTSRPIGLRSFQVQALHFLLQEEVVRYTPDGQRLYLTGKVHEVNPAFLPPEGIGTSARDA